MQNFPLDLIHFGYHFIFFPYSPSSVAVFDFGIASLDFVKYHLIGNN